MSNRIDVPEGWQLLNLGDVLTLRNEIIHPRNRPTGVRTFVGLEHIESGTGQRIGSVQMELAAMTGRRATFKAEDIVYGYLRPYLNKVWVAEFDGICSVDQYVFISDTTIADPRFIASYMLSDQYLTRAPISATPGQLPRIRIDEVLQTEIALPPLDRQRELVCVVQQQLAVLRKIRASALMQVAEIDRLGPALLNAAVSGALA